MRSIFTGKDECGNDSLSCGKVLMVIDFIYF